MRTIFHVDVNSAFLSWSALKRLAQEPGSVDLRTIPSAVGGDIKTRHGVITAKSIPAKQFGIQTGEPVARALQKCPHLVLVSPDFECYRSNSRRLMKLLSGYTPVLQQMSVDEAYLDVSSLLSDDARNNRSEAIDLARQIREDVSKHLGFTVNVGISNNKLLAKMASDFKKPDLTHTLYPDEIPSKMWPLPISSLYGCGKATAARLYSVGITTIGEAAAMDTALLQSVLGEKAGLYISRSADGIGSDTVIPEREQAKSVSNEMTLSEDVGKDNYESAGIPVIRKLSAKVASRLQKAGLQGQTVTFQVKSSGFQRFSRQNALPEATGDAAKIEETALLLAERLLQAPDGLFASGISIRLIGVGVSRLTQTPIHQMDLFEWAAENDRILPAADSARQAKLEAMLREVNKRYGEGTLKKAGLRTPDRN